jgi:chromosome segregation ATPase
MVTKTKKKAVSKTVAKVARVARVTKEIPAYAPETVIPLGALQSLVGLSETLKKMSPEGDRKAPKIILTSSGMELLFDSVEPGQGTAADAAALSAVVKRVAQLEQTLEPLLKKTARAQTGPGIAPERLAKIEEELKALRQSTAAIEKKLESHSAAVESVRAALSQNEELVEGIVETLQMLNGVRDDLAEDPLAAAS